MIEHRGGKRKGAGRKPSPVKKVCKSLYFTPEAVEILGGYKGLKEFVYKKVDEHVNNLKNGSLQT